MVHHLYVRSSLLWIGFGYGSTVYLYVVFVIEIDRNPNKEQPRDIISRQFSYYIVSSMIYLGKAQCAISSLNIHPFSCKQS